MTYAPPGAPPPYYPQPSPAPAARTVLPASRTFAVIFTLLAVLLTAGAVALATYAGQQTATGQDAAPSGWSQVYDASLATPDSNWDTTQGCQFSNGGLLVQSSAVCQFLPSTTQDLTSQGFLLRLTIAPSADIVNDLEPFVVLGNSDYIGVTSSGQYSLCDTASCSASGQVHVQGTTIDWHADVFVTNTMAVKYDAQAGQVTLYLNGVQVASGPLAVGSSAAIGLATSSTGEALFTHATLYSGSANGLGG